MAVRPGRNKIRSSRHAPRAGGLPLKLALMTIVVAAAGIRLVHLQQPLFSFHPTRQYRSAMIARDCYYQHTPRIPDWARRIAELNREVQPAGEPPIMEWLACHTYRFVGHESFAVPRVLGAWFWIAGGLPICLIFRRFVSAEAALIGLALYLCIPFAIEASRAFQPDALMTCSALWAVLALGRAHERASGGRIAAAALAVTLATLVKPMSVFVTVPAAIGFAIPCRERRALNSLGVPVGLGLAAGLAYYAYSALFGTLARDQMTLRFVPSLLDSRFFWDGMTTQVGRVFGGPLFGLAVGGTALARARPLRALLLAWWTGYAVFAVAFTYHMPTHDYYHLPYVALVALGTAALVDRVQHARRLHDGRLRRAAALVAVGIAVWGVSTAWPRLNRGEAGRVGLLEEIGAAAGHPARALFLDREYGYPLMYHGQVSGDAWPSVDDLAAESLGGALSLDAESRFARDYAHYQPTHFIVTDLDSLAVQPDLERLLADRATLLRQTPSYRVYLF